MPSFEGDRTSDLQNTDGTTGAYYVQFCFDT